MKTTLAGLVWSLGLAFTSALYFHSGEREEKCLIEDIPKDTLITGRFKMQQWDIQEHDFLPSAPGLGMMVTIKAPNEERIHLDIQIGKHLLDVPAAESKDKVEEVTMRLEHLAEQIHQIIKEQNHQREREEHYRLKSEATNSNVLWWAVAQTLILLSIGLWQITRLKYFLIEKKLV